MVQLPIVVLSSGSLKLPLQLLNSDSDQAHYYKLKKMKPIENTGLSQSFKLRQSVQESLYIDTTQWS